VSHKLLVKDQQGEREVLLVDSLAVGRDPHCDISVPDPLLSRRHAEFVASGQTVIVRDLNSRNGTLVNGRRLPEAVLHPGDVVQIAQLVVTFVSRAEADTMLAPSNGAGGEEERTSLLTPAEIQAVAASSALDSRTPANGAGTVAGPPDRRVLNGDGARKSGAWSVQLVAEDDRTNRVAPNLPPPDRLRESVPPPLPTTVSGQAIQPLPATSMVPTGSPLPQPEPAPDAPRPGVHWPVAVRTLVLAVVCFTFGVASTMIWLKPPLTARWLLLDHVPLAVAAGFVFILLAGGLVGRAIGKMVGRAESN
jgi:pSer/pThr/pTyr-binding forkhead associated (FHA) protein